MALINNIGAGIYTTLKYTADTSNATLPTSDAEHQAFVDGDSGVSFVGILVDEITSTSTSADISITSLVGTLPTAFTLVLLSADGNTTVNLAVTSHTTTGNVLEVNFVADAANVISEEAGATYTATGTGGAFASSVEVTGIREFPSFGAPANIINVPVYGQATSDQISGQSDAPTLEITLNYVPETHKAIQALVTEGSRQIFQVRMANAEAADANDAVFYVKGTVASFLVSPNLTDSNQATISIATEGSYFGPFAS